MPRTKPQPAKYDKMNHVTETRREKLRPIQSFGQSVMEGVAVGTGMAIARNAVDGVINMFSRKSEKVAPAPEEKNVCDTLYKNCIETVENPSNCDKIFVQCAPTKQS